MIKYMIPELSDVSLALEFMVVYEGMYLIDLNNTYFYIASEFTMLCKDLIISSDVAYLGCQQGCIKKFHYP